jgi:hypothetical protein
MPGVANQFFIIFEIRFQKADILEVAKVLLVKRVGHFFVFHFVFPFHSIAEKLSETSAGLFA